MPFRVSSPSGLMPKKHRNPFNILEKSMDVCEETIYKSYDDDDSNNNLLLSRDATAQTGNRARGGSD